MTKKHNAHDSGYKKLFSNPVLIKQLLISFVSGEWVNGIDFNTLERIDKSFISDEFTERESDLIYKAKFEGKDLYIFILLEFQSTVDRFMALRMLRYITELYEYLVRNQKLKKLPAVFPVMLYNGEKKWTAPEELNTLIENSIPKQYIPEFRYYKIAENEFSKDFLISLNNSVAALFYTENCSGEELQHEIDNIAELLKSEKPVELSLFINWFAYMFQDRAELVEEIKGIEEVKSMLRTSIKKYGKQLLQEGIQEGIEKGIRKKAVETARILLFKKMPLNEIAEITGLTTEEIKMLDK
jgi:predicted transposase/invertase (TIGR01784 family)